MSENPPLGAVPAPPPGRSGYADESTSTPAPGTVEVAMDQATSVAQGAADAGQQVASVAKDQAQNVVAEAGSQATDLLDQARSELGKQAAVQQQRLITGLRALGEELASMARHSGQSGVATDLARQASGRSHEVAAWLEGREPGDVVNELRSFARQRPGMFLAAAAGAGLLAGRLTRGVKDASDDSGNAAPPGTGAHRASVPLVLPSATPARMLDPMPAGGTAVGGGPGEYVATGDGL